MPSLQIPVSAGNPSGLFNPATPTVSNFVNSVNAGAVPAFDGGVPGTAFGRYSLAQFRQNQVSEELQIIGEFNRLKYQIGGRYYQERVQDNAQAINTAELIGATGAAVVYLRRRNDYQG